jgi:hypothetical protein
MVIPMSMGFIGDDFKKSKARPVVLDVRLILLMENVNISS